ncbi:MAG: type II toxin-antitoxin system VapC family toxin [Bryobacterales bacterium]|nr:type II toxin-antitoxin system VapC family toxin [Bryobacterales bacterium]
MIRYVLDASVAAKWVLPANGEPLSKEAALLLAAHSAGEVRFLVPDLFWSEIASILRKAAKAGRISERSAVDAAEWLARVSMRTQPVKPFMVDALKLAFALDISAYDSSYLTLASLSKSQMVTADLRLVRAAGPSLPVMWLGTVRSD